MRQYYFAVTVVSDRCFQLIQHGLPHLSQLGNNHRTADMQESPVDLSQSAADFKTPASAAAESLSQCCRPSGCSVPSAGNTCGALSVCYQNVISSPALHSSLTFLTASASDLDVRTSSVNSLPLGSACRTFTIPCSDVYQNNNHTCDDHNSAAARHVNHDAAIKPDPLSSSSESSCKKLSAGSSGSESDGYLQYPKTKKQKAVDSKALSAEVATSSSTVNLFSLPTAVDSQLSEYAALTFGEIQERLITKVVESGSLSGALCDDQQRVVGTGKHYTSGISTAKLPTGRFFHCKPSPVQNSASQASEVASSEWHNLPRAGILLRTSASSLPQQQQSVITSTQGL